MIEWYSYNVTALSVILVVALLALSAQFIVREERAKLKRERAEFEKEKAEYRYGKKI